MDTDDFSYKILKKWIFFINSMIQSFHLRLNDLEVQVNQIKKRLDAE